MNVSWKGIYPALTTKFTTEDQLDFDLIGKNLNFQIESGVNGIILGGSLGEASTLSADEKNELLSFSLNWVNNKIPVIMNIAEQSTKEAVKAAREAERIGAQGLMVLPPMRYNADDRETVEFFRSIAQSTSLPMILYNNPVDYKINITLDMLDQLSNMDNIQGVKESTRDVSNVTRMKNRFQDRYKILTGVDTLALESLLLGADGWVAGLVCAFPKETVAIYRLVKAEKVSQAVEIYRWFLPVLELDISPKLVQNIKLAEKLNGLGNEIVRAPRLPLIGKEREKVIQLIEEAISNRPNLEKYQIFDHTLIERSDNYLV